LRVEVHTTAANVHLTQPPPIVGPKKTRKYDQD